MVQVNCGNPRIDRCFTLPFLLFPYTVIKIGNLHSFFFVFGGRKIARKGINLFCLVAEMRFEFYQPKRKILKYKKKKWKMFWVYKYSELLLFPSTSSVSFQRSLSSSLSLHTNCQTISHNHWKFICKEMWCFIYIICLFDVFLLFYVELKRMETRWGERL